MMRYMYVRSGTGGDMGEVKRSLADLLSPLSIDAARAALEAADRALSDYDSDPDPDKTSMTAGTFLYDYIVPAIESCGVSTLVIEDELILVVCN